MPLNARYCAVSGTFSLSRQVAILLCRSCLYVQVQESCGQGFNPVRATPSATGTDGNITTGIRMSTVWHTWMLLASKPVLISSKLVMRRPGQRWTRASLCDVGLAVRIAWIFEARTRWHRYGHCSRWFASDGL